MATEDDSESSFELTIEDLQEIVKLGEIKIIELGGIDEICSKLQTNPTDGLMEEEEDLEIRRTIFGSNLISMKKGKSFLILVWEAIQDVTLIILMAAAAISIGLAFYKPEPIHEDLFIEDDAGHSWIEGLAIIITVLIVVLITSLNDWEKERRYRNLQKRIQGQNKFTVLRNGEPETILSSDIVVGDVCYIKYGDKVPADGIITQSHDLMIDESSMTGESDAVKKDARNPILLSGTNVMEGSGKMLVIATGVNSQVGIISVLLGSAEAPQKKTKTKTKTKTKDKKKSQPKEEKSEEIEVVQEKLKPERRDVSVLKTKLTRLAIQIGYGGLAVSVLTMATLIIRFAIKTYIMQGKSWEAIHSRYFVHCVIIGITILVVAIPEGLPLAVTLALIYSVKKMTNDNNLVRHLDACETMGNATVICSDKTGTLTTNRMTVVTSYICEELYTETPGFSYIPTTVAYALVEGIAINTSYSSNMLPPMQPNGLPYQVGNRTECALLGFVEDLGINYEILRNRHPEESFIKVYTFNSMRKSMSTVIRRRGGGYRIYTKGASEIILQKCSFIHNYRGDVQEITNEMRAELMHDVIEVMASDSLRTICLAYKDFVHVQTNIHQELLSNEPNWDDEDSIVSNLTCIAIVGIEDPVRPEVPEAIKKCQRAGITVCMITGDNVNTAKSIAVKCGILTPENLNDQDCILEGEEFNRRIRDSSGEQYLMDKVWPKLKVLARSSPSDKYTLVKGIIESKVNVHREVVAATGDGTNDGPALRIADVGFAMGISGTDVAKDASDIILTDDNFNSIVAAVLWGRNVYDSICKFLKFQLTVNIVAVICAFVSACSIQLVPLSAIQMLWVNLIMDSLASLALATEAPTEDLLLRKPYGRTKSLISKNMLKNIIGQAFYQLTIMFLFLYNGHILLNIPEGTEAGPSEHFTFVFNSFVMMTLCNEINSRKLHGERNVFKNFFKNPCFCIILFGSLFAQIIIVQFGGKVLSTKSLDEEQWLWCIFCGISTIIFGQILNCLKRFPVLKSKVLSGNVI